MELIKNAIVLTLVLSLSGVFPAATNALADPPTNPTAAAEPAPTSPVDEDLKLLVRRAKHPDSPGTPGGVPSIADQIALELRFRAWKGDVERQLALPTAPTADGTGAYVSIESKLRLVNLYFTELGTLIMLRIAMNQPHGAEWSDRYALLVTANAMDDFPGLGATAENRLGDRFFPTVIDRGDDGKADPVRLKISQSAVQGLELGALAENPTDENFLTMIQYLGVRQLLSSLSEIRTLKQDHTVALPPIPAALAAKLGTLGLSDEIVAEQRQATAEPGARKAVAAEFPAVAGALPSFVDTSYVTELANLLGPTDEAKRGLVEPLTEKLAQAEAATTIASLNDEIEAVSLPMSAMKAGEMLPTLRYLVSNAKANTQVSALLGMRVIMVLPVAQRVQLLGIVDAHRKTYANRLPEASLRGWFAAAKRTTDDALFADARSQFIENLLVSSPSVAEEFQRTYDGTAIDPAIFGRAFAKDIATVNETARNFVTQALSSQDTSTFGVRDSVRGWWDELTHATTWASARDRYAKIFAAQADATVVKDGRVLPSAVEAYLANHDFSPGIQIPGNAALAAKLKTRLAEARKRDLRNFLSIGDWWGFTRANVGDSPSVRDLLDSKHLDAYYKALDQSVLTRFPILSMEVAYTDSNGATGSRKLYDALNAVDPERAVGVAELEAAAPLVDQALAALESKIAKDVETIGDSKSLEDVQKIVEGTLMLSLVMKGFPEFRLEQSSFIETMLEPSFFNQFMGKYVGRYIAWGFGALFVLQMSKKFIKKTGPIVDIAMEALEPLVQGYMRSATVLVLADASYQAHELYVEHEHEAQIEELATSTAQGQAFFDRSELDAAFSAYRFKAWMFAGRMVLDTVTMWIPMARQAITARGERVLMREFLGDVEAFDALGLKPGQWSELDAALARVREAAPAPDALVVAESAHARLAAKLKAGQDWNLDKINSGDVESAIDKKLAKLLKPKGTPKTKPAPKGETKADGK